MGFLWVLGAIAAGTLIAMLAGAILDYLQVRNVLSDSFRAWLFLPYTMGFAGLLSSIISVSMYGRYLKNRAAVQKGAGTKPGKKSATPKGMEHVPGMPVFDVDAIRQGSRGTGAPPATGQGPAPPPAAPAGHADADATSTLRTLPPEQKQ